MAIRDSEWRGQAAGLRAHGTICFLPFFSSARSCSLISSAGVKPPIPPAATMRWQGTTSGVGLRAMARPTARGDVPPALQSPRMSQCCHTAPPGLRDRSWWRPNRLHRRQSIILTGLQDGRHNTSGPMPGPGRNSRGCEPDAIDPVAAPPDMDVPETQPARTTGYFHRPITSRNFW